VGQASGLRRLSEPPVLMPPNLTISKVGPSSATILENLFQYYLHDMSEWFDIDSYDLSTIWKSDVYLATFDDTPAAFALIGPASDDPTAQDVHEFFVLRKFRRSRIGYQLASHVWNDRRGEWRVRVLEANAAAVSFWRTTISTYSHGSYQEDQRTVNDRPWRFFRFTSEAA